MKPIEFTIEKNIQTSPPNICERILDVQNWNDYDGYGVLPGIEKAEFELRTENLKGSRIRVWNSDGSEHIEEIIEWRENRKLVMKMYDFPAALSLMASHFIEEWDFAAKGENETLITRKFQLFPQTFLSRPMLVPIASLMEKAVKNHLEEIAKDFEND